MVAEPIKITGLAEFSRDLRKLDKELPKGLRLAANEAGQIVVDYVKPKVPKRTGHAASTVKTKSTRTVGRVVAGSNRYPYYAWLDFGGSVGRKRSVKRTFIKEGRYLYPGYDATRDDVEGALYKALLLVARQANVEVQP